MTHLNPRSWLRACALVLVAIAGACQSTPDYDFILRNGTIYDGSGAAPVIGDVAIRADRIAAVGDVGNARAREEIDVTGLAVAPGFINMLSWATESLLVDGHSQSDIRQGVTLEVMGEGWSMGPLNEAMRRDLATRQGALRYDVAWTTLGEYLDHVVERGVATNVASFVGATTVRIHELGYEDRRPTAEELTRMQALVARAMEEGALGLGSSLIYAPAFYADTEELAQLCRVVALYGGMHVTHMRSEGDRLLEGVQEVIDISSASGAAAEIYHLKAAGADNWPKLDAVIAAIEAANARGPRLTADMYTYTAGATGLNASMPPWVQEGGLNAWIERLRDPATRERVRREITTPGAGVWENLFLASGPDKMILVGFKQEALKPLIGKTLADVAQMRGVSPAEAAMDLVVEDGSRVETVYFMMSEENVRRQIALPWVSFCSDAASMAPEGAFAESSCHPRAYGNFARLLGRYVRDEQIIPLEEAVRRLTSLPAANLRIESRGSLQPGYYADLAIFDPQRIQDHATFEDPHQYSTGMVHVLVNGTPVLRDGEHTGAMPGRVVHGPGHGRRGLWQGVVQDDVTRVGFGPPERAPKLGWDVAETNGAGRTASWTVGKSPGAVSVTTENTGQTYNLLLQRDQYPGDVAIAVNVSAESGREDRGGGVVWRATGPNDYYIARWNPLENNVRYYKVVGGVRTQLGSATVEADAAVPHRLEVRAWGPYATISLDGERLFTVRDETFALLGKVGLWTKADASTSFSDLTITVSRLEQRFRPN